MSYVPVTVLLPAVLLCPCLTRRFNIIPSCAGCQTAEICCWVGAMKTRLSVWARGRVARSCAPPLVGCARQAIEAKLRPWSNFDDAGCVKASSHVTQAVRVRARAFACSGQLRQAVGEARGHQASGLCNPLLSFYPLVQLACCILRWQRFAARVNLDS